MILSNPRLSIGDMFQGPQQMPEIADSIKLYVYYAFSYIYDKV